MKTFVVFIVLLHVSRHAVAVLVEVNEGAGSVMLPCHFSGLLNKLKVMWTRSDLSPRFVHQSGGGNLGEQNERYRGRTSTLPNAFNTGDFSLSLREPHLNDSGNYTCNVTDGVGELNVTNVELKVKDHQEEVEVTEGAESVILPCRTSSDLPKEVTVEWTYSGPELKMVHAYPNTSRALLDQDGFFRNRTEMNKDLLRSGDVSLTLKLPTDRDTGSYICSIYRDKDILRQKVLLKVKAPFPSWATVLLVLLVLLIVAAGVLYHYRKCFLPVPQEQVVAESVSESVLLPCKTTKHLPGDVKVEWKDNINRKVHVYQKGSDQPEKQHRYYRTRTEMKTNPLQHGDLSLTLKYPIDENNQIFTCSVYSRERNVLMKKDIVLTVRVPQVKVKVESEAESVLMPCQTTIALPEDAKVKWKDSHRTVHVFQFNSSAKCEEQHPLYQNKTEMKASHPGDLSLTLKYPTDADSRSFTCSVFNRERNTLMKAEVLLTVRVCRVEVEEGAESVLLPFRTTPDLPGDAKVEWKRIKPDPEVLVHSMDGEQDQFYRNRTKMEADFLQTGNLSLTLKQPAGGDAGEYECRVCKGDYLIRAKKIQLKVTGTAQDQTEDMRSRFIDPTPLMADQLV